MTRYFIAANLWLMFSAIVFLGRTEERTEPTRYAFFHTGWYSPVAYNLFLFASIALAGLFFALTWKTRAK